MLVRTHVHTYGVSIFRGNEMTKRSRKQNKVRQQRPIPWRNLLITFIIFVALSAAAWFVRNRSENADEAVDPIEAPVLAVTPAPASQYRGASYCQARPAFISDFELTGQPIIGTSLRGFTGFTVAEQMATGEIGRIIQHPTWTEAGNLGAYTRDGDGNIYTAPVPFSSVELNDPEMQTLLYIIPSVDGIMRPFSEVPAEQAPTEQNCFGVMGLFFDCDTKSLYAASIAGSTAQDEVGCIARIDIESGEVVDRLKGVDALGVGVHNGVNGKRLYFGLARNSAVVSIALDEEGNFTGEPRQEFFLAGLPGGGNDKAQRITFTQDGQMIVKGTEFDYTLRASSDSERALYFFSYLPAEDAWELTNVDRTDAPIIQ